MNSDNDASILMNLVLIGGGHSHVEVLRAFAMRPVEGVRITLVSPDAHTAYSGMLPGLLAGHYEYDDAHIDLHRLAGSAKARFIQAAVTGLNLESKTIALEGRPAIPFDVASINTGSSPSLSKIAGAERYVLPVKPVKSFLAQWAKIEEALRTGTVEKVVSVVGAGAGGVELALAIRHRLADSKGTTIRLFEAAPEILPGFLPAVQARVRGNLEDAEIDVVTGCGVAGVRKDQLLLTDGTVHNTDYVLWTTGAAPHRWFADSGLATDEQGFLATLPTLQCQNAEAVFAVGDCATMIDAPRPKAGVFAVRQGPVLAGNLRRFLLGRPLETHNPQKRFLTILAMGRKHAIAVKGPLSAEGDWVWRWKSKIDTAFMDRYSASPAMDDTKVRDRLPALPRENMYCAGCGSKLPASALTRALARLGVAEIGGIGEDAAVFDPPAGKRLAVSVDHFTAIIDDPFTLGKIAANHALGDLYATGATPLSVLAIATVPRAIDSIAEEDLFQLLAGAQTVFESEKVTLLGGHTSVGRDMALGFSVTGSLARNAELSKAGLTPGDALILTKPLGTGAIFAASMRGKAKGRWIECATDSMAKSVAPALEVLRKHGVSGLTDVTGFGLAGHLGEMLTASRVSAVLDKAAIPALDGALSLLSDGIESSLAPANAERLELLTGNAGGPLDPVLRLLCDPQTAGGLLAGISRDAADACVSGLREAGDDKACVIGRVEAVTGSACELRFT